MLPPVPSTSVALQANQRQASAPQTEPSAPVADDNIALTAAARLTSGPTSSLDLLDLSGQLRLGQSLSVFAETLGSLLQLPRREGEALADYSKRLAAAINALNATERTRLQAQLNQIMQGATLRLLAELLKDPSGPAAARLAVQIEIAQYHETDLATRNAVSSYRQNNGSDTTRMPANTNPADGTRTGTNPPTVARDSSTSGNRQQGVSGGLDAAAAIFKDNTSPARTAVEPGTPALPAVSGNVAESTAGKSLAGGQMTKSIAVATNPGSDVHQLPEADTDNADSAATPATASDTTEGPDAEYKQRTGIQTTGNKDAKTSTPNMPADVSTPTRKDVAPRTTGTIYDAAALARRAHAESSPHDMHSPKTMVDHFVTEWISESLPGKSEVRQSRQVLAGQTATETMSSAWTKPPVDEDIDTAKLKAHSNGPSDDEALFVQPNALTTPAAIPTAAKAAQHVDSAFEKALLGMMAPPREPPAHPLVPHAGAQEFDDSQDHAIKRKPAVGDDGQPSRQGFGGGQFSKDEKQSAQEDAPTETVLSQIDTEAPVELDAKTVETGLRQAPQQHLSSNIANDLTAGAEDFYRRMAVLE